MTWLELTIIYLALGCGVGTWLIFKDLSPRERIVSKMLKRVFFWPAYLLSLSKRKSLSNPDLTNAFVAGKIPDALEAASEVLESFPQQKSSRYFEFKGDLERYVGLATNVAPESSDLSDFYRIGNQRPTRLQGVVISRLQRLRVLEHLNRARDEFISSVVSEKSAGDSVFIAKIEKLFETLSDGEASEVLKERIQTAVGALDNEEQRTEVMPWIRERRTRVVDEPPHRLSHGRN